MTSRGSLINNSMIASDCTVIVFVQARLENKFTMYVQYLDSKAVLCLKYSADDLLVSRVRLSREEIWG
jgi:hypothetical protein